MKTENHIQQIYPLSPLQEGILFHSLYDKNQFTYFEQMSYRISGDLDITLLKKSLDTQVDRHDILRTAFVHENTKRPLQVVLKKREPGFHYEDLRKFDLKEKDIYVAEFKEKDKQRSFNLAKDVLWRLSVLHLADLDYEIIWSYHHILLDGWSKGLLVTEFFEIYNSYKENREPRLPEVIPYRNYIQWLEDREKERSIAYWKSYLEGYEGNALTKVIQRNFPVKNSYDNRYFSIRLGRERTQRLNQMAAKYPVFLNTLFQALWGIILAKYNMTRDVVYGVVVSGRTPEIPGIETMIGLFINTIPLRVTYNEETRFNELLKKIQEKAIEAEVHHHCPLAEIQSVSDPKQNLLDHIWVFENYPISKRMNEVMGIGLENQLKIMNFEVFEQTNYNLNLLVEPGDDFHLKFNYNANIMDSSFIKAAGSHFIQLIEQILENEFSVVDELALLTGEERNRVLYDFNKTEMDCFTDKTVHRLFEEQAERTPGHIALLGPQLPTTNHRQGSALRRDEDKDTIQLTYGELNQKSAQLALLLQEKGVYTDTIVAIMLERSIEMIIGILGILKSGGAYLPIDPELPQERIDYMLKDSNAKILLTDKKEINCQLSIINSQLTMSERPRRGLKGHPHWELQHSNHLCYIIYTSGSTGKPKGALLEHKNLVNLLIYTSRFTNLDFSALLQFSTISFDASFQEIFSALLSGGKLLLIDTLTRRQIPLLFEILAKNKIKTVFLPISLLKMIFSEAEYIKKFPPCITHIQTAGEQVLVTDNFKDYLKQKQVYLHNHYGPSETHVVTTYTVDPTGDIPRLPPIGKPVFNTPIYILDQGRNLQPVGIPGELYIQGIQVGRGYLNNPELTAERFRPLATLMTQMKPMTPITPIKNKNGTFRANFHQSPLTTHHSPIYRTGDLARWLPDGNIEFLGRLDLQVKIRGFRIEPGEVENHLLKHGAVKEVVVVTHENENNDKYLCAYIVPVSGFEPDPAELRSFLAAKFPDYMIPAYFVTLERIPFTATGKLDRKALPVPGIHAGDQYIAPENVLEIGIVHILADILGVEAGKISINAHLFDIGVNSITLLKLSHRFSRELDSPFPISELLDNPTLKKIAQDMQKKYPPTRVKRLVLLNAGKADRNLFFISGDGTVFGFKEMAKLLEQHVNVYCFQARGIMENCPLPATREQFLEEYIKEMKIIQPNGPYLLGGHCYGAIISYYMTEVMEQRSDKIDKLILLDEPAMLTEFVFKNLWILKAHKIWKKLTRKLMNLRGIVPGKKNKIKEEQENSKEAYQLPADLEARRKEVQANMDFLFIDMINHTGIVNAPQVVFMALEQKAPDNPRWNPKLLARQSKQSVEILRTPGNHWSMLKPPHVTELARQLLEQLLKLNIPSQEKISE